MPIILAIAIIVMILKFALNRDNDPLPKRSQDGAYLLIWDALPAQETRWIGTTALVLFKPRRQTIIA
jgi:hypothetical protein